MRDADLLLMRSERQSRTVENVPIDPEECPVLALT